VHHHHHHDDEPCCGPLVTGVLWGLLAVLNMIFVPAIWTVETSLQSVLLVTDIIFVVVLAVLGILAHANHTIVAAARYRMAIIIYAAKTALNFFVYIVLLFMSDVPAVDDPNSHVTLPPGFEGALLKVVAFWIIVGTAVNLGILYCCYSCATTYLRKVSKLEMEMTDLAHDPESRVPVVVGTPVGTVPVFVQSTPLPAGVVFAPAPAAYPVAMPVGVPQAVPIPMAGMPTGFASQPPVAVLQTPGFAPVQVMPTAEPSRQVDSSDDFNPRT